MVQQPHYNLVFVKSAQYKQVNTVTEGWKLDEINNHHTQTVTSVLGCETELASFMEQTLSSEANTFSAKFHEFCRNRRRITVVTTAPHTPEYSSPPAHILLLYHPLNIILSLKIMSSKWSLYLSLVKGKAKVQFALEHAMKAQRGVEA